jgi:hypothetical protein
MPRAPTGHLLLENQKHNSRDNFQGSFASAAAAVLEAPHAANITPSAL